MVQEQIMARGITSPRLIEVLMKIPRHLFVQEAMAAQAYSDGPLPIGEKQTISQPFMVALMTDLLELTPRDHVLEIGTGSGYQTAILASLVRRVWTIERIRPLAMQARKVLDSLHLLNVNIKVGDGTLGWEEEAPFDAILVTAGAPAVPETLARQLAPGGRLVIPVGSESTQTLLRIRKEADGSLTREAGIDCRFVPLIGQQGWHAPQ
ncbi:protein-L-isoaspartate(D-aspartate) O-methyltransferase [Trichlorobacter ammonificans]|nr:protein-L-isoaspartate(D-aspartate) O-methyltransferase [Trichlorobacter ammonificans]